jgi:hypothetical protein
VHRVNTDAAADFARALVLCFFKRAHCVKELKTSSTIWIYSSMSRDDRGRDALRRRSIRGQVWPREDCWRSAAQMLFAQAKVLHAAILERQQNLHRSGLNQSQNLRFFQQSKSIK